MNFKRVLSIVLVCIMAALCCSACAGASSTITVSFEAYCGDTEIGCEHGSIIHVADVVLGGDNPTILDALAAAADRTQEKYKLDKAEKTVDDIGKFKYRVDKENGIGYAWTPRVNGEEIPVLAGDYVIKDGDVIRYEYISFELEGYVAPTEETTAE